uniref:Uncharacterized protein n=1 Tax=Anguilla anguilla TaxID=7936 RepID=A0A0E9RDI0_ANGAN
MQGQTVLSATIVPATRIGLNTSLNA